LSQVTLEVGGRSYTLACAEGEEAHILKLGRMIDEKVTGITGGKPAAESQSLLFAALMLADELHEAVSRPQRSADDKLADVLERCAERLESCATMLEQSLPTS